MQYYVNAIDFDNVNLSFLTKATNSVGNFFFTPVRYYLGGRSGTCFHIVIELENDCGNLQRFCYGNIEEKKSNLIKTALSMALFIPGLIIGAAFKTPGIIFSEKLRFTYNEFEEIKSLEDKASHELKIGIALNRESHISNFLKYIDQMENVPDFFARMERTTPHYAIPIKAAKLAKLKNKEITVKKYLELQMPV